MSADGNKPAAIDLPPPKPKKAPAQPDGFRNNTNFSGHPIVSSPGGGGGGGNSITYSGGGGAGGAYRGGGGPGHPAAIDMSPNDQKRAERRRLEAEQDHFVELHSVGRGLVGHINTRNGDFHPNEPNPPRGGPPAPAIGEHPRLKELLGEANAADPATASNIRFRGRLDRCLNSKPSELVSWGEQDLALVRKASDAQAQIAKRIGTINAASLADKCRVASTKPPGLLGRLSGSNANFYEQTLTAIRPQLVAITSEIESAETDIRQHLDGMRLDILALQMTIKTISEPGAQQVAAGRLRNMVAAQQMAVMALQGFTNMKTTNNKLIEDIDTLLNTVIPGWKLAGG